MVSQTAQTKQPISDDITDEQIQQLIDERGRLGATCKVVKENNQRFLVCEWPPL